MFSHPPALLKQLYPSLVWEIETSKKEVFITFDDGPTVGVTDKVLDLLKQFNANATFFCLGKNIKRHPFLKDRILVEGHKIGNHTYNHLNGWKSSTVEYSKDTQLFEEEYHSALFRPPYGKIKRSQIAAIKKKYRIIMWSILSMDYNKSISPEECKAICLKKLQLGSIVVFHDSKKAEKNMLFALKGLLKYCQNQGIKCSVIE